MFLADERLILMLILPHLRTANTLIIIEVRVTIGQVPIELHGMVHLAHFPLHLYLVWNTRVIERRLGNHLVTARFLVDVLHLD